MTPKIVLNGMYIFTKNRHTSSILIAVLRITYSRRLSSYLRGGKFLLLLLSCNTGNTFLTVTITLILIIFVSSGMNREINVIPFIYLNKDNCIILFTLTFTVTVFFYTRKFQIYLIKIIRYDLAYIDYTNKICDSR